MLTKKESSKIDYERHKQSYIDRATKWNKENVEKHREYDKKWKQKARRDPKKYAKMLESVRKSYQNNIDKRRKTANELSAKYRNIVLDHYGRVCKCCGETMEEFLTIDHINNDGATHRRSLHTNGGSNLQKWLIKNNFPEGFQILCWNCNCGKRIGKGICPHKKGGIYIEPSTDEEGRDPLDGEKQMQTSPPVH